MAGISKIEISMCQTINLGNFESFRCDVTIEERFGPGEYTEEKYENLRSYVQNKLSDQIERIKP